MGMGPSLWDRMKGWFRDKILNQTPTHGIPRVSPEKEERTVVLSEKVFMEPAIEFDYKALIRGEDDGGRWGEEVEHHSSFDYSSRSHVRGQGVVFSEPREGRQVWQERRFLEIPVTLINTEDRQRYRVLEPIRRFLGLNLGNRMHVSYHGHLPERPEITDEMRQFASHDIFGFVFPRLYYQKVLRLYGTRAYFDELEQAGIIETSE